MAQLIGQLAKPVNGTKELAGSSGLTMVRAPIGRKIQLTLEAQFTRFFEL
jgi:hypothetical protein